MRYWKKFKDKNKLPDVSGLQVGLSVATYRQGPKLSALLDSILAQTHQNFLVVVCHDGPWDVREHLDLQVRFGSDDRFHFVNTPERKNTFGHNCRAQVQDDLAIDVDYVGYCNGDVYYTPTYFEWMLAHAWKQNQAKFVYCNMVHSHTMWQPMKTELKRGKIDVGCFLAASESAFSAEWREDEFAADWFYIKQMTDGLRKDEIAKVDGYLYVHS